MRLLAVASLLQCYRWISNLVANHAYLTKSEAVPLFHQSEWLFVWLRFWEIWWANIGIFQISKRSHVLLIVLQLAETAHLFDFGENVKKMSAAVAPDHLEIRIDSRSGCDNWLRGVILFMPFWEPKYYIRTRNGEIAKHQTRQILHPKESNLSKSVFSTIEYKLLIFYETMMAFIDPKQRQMRFHGGNMEKSR